MATRDCWYCEKDAHLTIVSEPIRATTDPKRPSYWSALFKCDHCGRGSIGQLLIKPNQVEGSSASIPPTGNNTLIDVRVKALLDHPDSDVEWLPSHVLGRRFDDVPEWIADAASEAYACYSIRSYRAAILLARSVVEAVAKNQGVTSGLLAAKIDTLAEKQLIRPLIQQSAHEIRHLGNDMAHGDFVEPTTAEDADDVLDFMSVVLAEVYQLPAQVNARKSTRAARKEAARARKAEHGEVT